MGFRKILWYTKKFIITKVWRKIDILLKFKSSKNKQQFFISFQFHDCKIHYKINEHFFLTVKIISILFLTVQHHQPLWKVKDSAGQQKEPVFESKNLPLKVWNWFSYRREKDREGLESPFKQRKLKQLVYSTLKMTMVSRKIPMLMLKHWRIFNLILVSCEIHKRKFTYTKVKNTSKIKKKKENLSTMEGENSIKWN